MSVLRRLLVGLLVLVAASSVVVPSASVFAAEEEAAAATHDAGPPNPVKESLSANLGLWSLIVFVLFLVVLTKLAWKPLAEGLDNRERRIRDDISAAEASRLKAEKMIAEHAAKLDRVQDEVKAILAEARRDAEVARQNIVSAAQAEADATKNRAIGEIERAKDQALKELFDTMAGRVADATEHVLGRGLNDADQQRLIDEALAGFSARSATRA